MARSSYSRRRRSEASKRGWRKRRSVSRRRSQSAKKAWATRRRHSRTASKSSRRSKSRSRSYSKKRRSAAAKKGWKTRRSHSRSASKSKSSRRSKSRSRSYSKRRRSAAAKKGWKTRRSHSRSKRSKSRKSKSRRSRSYSKRRRSTAAKKGWKTRRSHSRSKRSKSKSRSKRTKSRSRGTKSKRGCWGDFTLGEIRAITEDLKAQGFPMRMYRERNRMCQQLNKHFGIEESIDRSVSRKKEAAAIKRASQQAKKAARKSVAALKRRIGAAQGSYPGDEEAVADFIRAYQGKSYKTPAARVAAMTRDLRNKQKKSRQHVIDHLSAEEYEAWKNAPWDSDLRGIDTKGSDESFLEKLRKRGFLPVAEQESLISFSEESETPSPVPKEKEEEGGILSTLGF